MSDAKRMPASRVDELICGWSMMTGHAFKEADLNSLVDLIAQESEKSVAALEAENAELKAATTYEECGCGAQCGDPDSDDMHYRRVRPSGETK